MACGRLKSKLTASREAVEETVRREAGRVLATLIRLLGDFDAAEEARQEAFAAALEAWPTQGIPLNPGAWLVQTGRNKAIDAVRRAALFRTKIVDLESAAAPQFAEDAAFDADTFGDDQLRLIFTCCHPALSGEAQVALTLREICGLPTAAVARAFLVAEESMAQRLVRAKKKIREAGIPYETPEPAVLDQRIDGVLAVIYSVFTEGYAVTAGVDLIDAELCREAIRLGHLLNALLPNRAAVLGLLALMLLHDARRGARTSDTGDIILLAEQNRQLWNHAQISEGLELVERALEKPGRVSHYAVEAAISALHARATTPETTDWPQIVGLYEVLLRLHPTPIVELNHAVAVSMLDGLDGARRAIDLIDSLSARDSVKQYSLLHAARGNFLAQLGRVEESRLAYAVALTHCKLDPERRLLARRIADLERS